MPLYAAVASGLPKLSELPEEVRESLLNLIILPPVVFSVALAYLSGHVWAYVIFARIFPDATGKSAENRQTQYIRFVLDHNIGRVALGLLWLALWLLVLAVLPWLAANRNLLITTDYITGRLAMIWILAMASEAALSVILLFIPARASDSADQSVKDDQSTQNTEKDAQSDGDAQEETKEETQSAQAAQTASDAEQDAQENAKEKTAFKLEKTTKTAKSTEKKTAEKKTTAEAKKTASKTETVKKTVGKTTAKTKKTGGDAT